jgi:hypothetical protein
MTTYIFSYSLIDIVGLTSKLMIKRKVRIVTRLLNRVMILRQNAYEATDIKSWRDVKNRCTILH